MRAPRMRKITKNSVTSMPVRIEKPLRRGLGRQRASARAGRAGWGVYVNMPMVPPSTPMRVGMVSFCVTSVTRGE